MWDQTRVAWKINRKKLGVSKGEKLIAIKAIIGNLWAIRNLAFSSLQIGSFDTEVFLWLNP
jgi:hypothetical protein